MPYILIVFAEGDHSTAFRLRIALERSGWNVHGVPVTLPPAELNDSYTQEELESAGCVIVLWSQSSTRSPRLYAHAAHAMTRGVLLSARIEQQASIPLSLAMMQTFELAGWSGHLDSQQFQQLTAALVHFVAAERIAGSNSPTDQTSLPRLPDHGEATATQRPTSTPVLFLCYRRDDVPDAAGRLYDRLAAAYGPERVFMDIDSVPLGIDFVDHVRAQIATCRAVIVMIGRQWLRIKGKNGRRRLDNPDDLVRAEIAAALAQKIPVIPVLLQNAAMPLAEDLPEDIRPLSRRNGIELRPAEWHAGVERLLKELDRVVGPRKGQ